MSNDDRTISNVKVSDDCYTELKVTSVRKKIRLQEVVAEILEKVTSKRLNKNSLEEQLSE